MNDIELFMYRVIQSISSMGAPVVFKGALVLKLLQMQTGNKSGLIRETKDIDGDWVSGKPSTEYLRQVVETAVKRAGYNDVRVETFREWGERRAAGFNFYDRNNTKLCSMDLSVKENIYNTVYCGINNCTFNGQIIQKTISDKVSVVTSRKVLRRIKDLIDIYILSFIYCGSYNDIIRVMKATDRSVGKADTFRYHTDEMKHAYSKYRNKASVLPFEDVYIRVLMFVDPFIRFSGEYASNDIYWNEVTGWQVL